MASSGAIGVARRRLDGEAKVRGNTRYAADLPVAGLLHARPVLAHEAHARITAIGLAQARGRAGGARAYPGVRLVRGAGGARGGGGAPGDRPADRGGRRWALRGAARPRGD